MQRRRIQRGGIVSAGYDRDRRILQIEFDTHRIVNYEGVGQEIAERFLTSASPMSHFRDEIEGEYPSSEVGGAGSTPATGKKKGVPDALKALFGDA